MENQVKQLTDKDPMPFGKHKGRSMQYVPASYLHWLWTQKGFQEQTDNPVCDYIRRNIRALALDYPDGIW